MSILIHFKKNELSFTLCRNRDKTLPVNINWDKVNCRECLQIKAFGKKKRWS